MLTPDAVCPAATCTIAGDDVELLLPPVPPVPPPVGTVAVPDGDGELEFPPQPASAARRRRANKVRYTGPVLLLRVQMNSLPPGVVTG
jgi:hypothetical protein